jgi:hypothetical protein
MKATIKSAVLGAVSALGIYYFISIIYSIVVGGTFLSRINSSLIFIILFIVPYIVIAISFHKTFKVNDNFSLSYIVTTIIILILRLSGIFSGIRGIFN